MSLPRAGRLLAVDIGERRHGVAHSDPTQIITAPVCTLTQRPGKRFPYKQLEPHLTEAVGVVVGLPLDEHGNESGGTARAREIAALIERRSGLPVELWDERFSTARALATAKEMGASTRGRKGVVDRMAAQLILQNYMDAHRYQE